MAERIERLEAAVEKLVAALGFQVKQVGLEPWLFVRSESYFDFDEPAAIPVTMLPGAPHEFKEKPVKFLWLHADGCNIRVSLNRDVSGESFVIPNGAILSIRRKTRTIYSQAVAGAGTLYVWGFY